MSQQHPDVQRVQVAFKAGQREQAVTLVRGLFRQGALLGDGWAELAKLALAMGEVTLALKASKRFSRKDRNDAMHQLHHAALLAEAGRVRAARSAMLCFERKGTSNPSVQHFLGTVKSQMGENESALRHFHQVLEQWPTAGQSWVAMVALKEFTPDDPDLLKMESLTDKFGGIDPQTHGKFLYALGKAWEDVGNTEHAFAKYSQGAGLFLQTRPFDQNADDRFCKSLLGTFTRQAQEALPASQCESTRPIFVTGLPRSGTTLVEQMLVSHSKVKDGGELNLLRTALMPLGGYSLAHARAYCDTALAGDDPWTDIANTYLYFLEERFGRGGI